MIEKIKIEKFKKFTDATVTVSPQGLSIIVGGNNSGKSSLLQALALWNFAKNVIVFSKGRNALDEHSRKDGVGVSFEDFTPMNIPSFDYLWTNLKFVGSYTMKIKVYWKIESIEKFLEIGFSLTQDRLFVKKTSSNISSTDRIPEIAYLPPFAGITEKEPWLTAADRRKQIGRGLSGSVIRNLIYDFYNEYEREFKEAAALPRRRMNARRKELQESTTFGKLNKILAEVFAVQLFPPNFSSEFHNYLKIPLKKGTWSGDSFQPFSAFSARDIMAEGRGFLQWLGTFCLLLNNSIDVLLLDEPDAHLHATLQAELIKYLELLSLDTGKLVLFATHSSEVIKSVPPSQILEAKNGTVKYCKHESDIQRLLLGLGVEHFPFLHKVQLNKKVVFVENIFDEKILKSFAEKLNSNISDKAVFWPMANNHKERKQVYLHLKNEIKGVIFVSLEDKDNLEYSQTDINLKDGSSPDVIDQTPDGPTNQFLPRRWRRWEMESYLINPKAIARIANVEEAQIENDLLTEFSIKWPSDFKQSDRTNSNANLFDRDGKAIIDFFEKKYDFSKINIPQYFDVNDIPDDVATFIHLIENL